MKDPRTINKRWPFNWRFWLAVGLTVLYLGGFSGVFSARSEGETLLEFLEHGKLNEIGDLFAGVFAPIAFLWLVYGYLLQSSELRLQRGSLDRQTQELELQRQALNEQRSELAKSSNALTDQAKLLGQQIEITRSTHTPKLNLTSVNAPAGMFRLSNQGGIALKLRLRMNRSDKVLTNPYLKSGEAWDVSFDAREVTSHPRFSAKYQDILGQTYENSWGLTAREGAYYSTEPPKE